jgi:PAS domain S-box-containing protein
MNRLFAGFTYATLRARSPIYFAALMGLGLILALDATVNEVVITPLLSLIMLTLLSFRLGPRSMLLCSVIYAAGVFYMLGLTPLDAAKQMRENPAPWVRFASFVVGAAVIVALSHHRRRGERQRTAFRDLLLRLPVATVVSDENGLITLVNEKAARLLGQSVEDLTGFSYFSVLTDPDARGMAIQRYVDLFQAKGGENIERETQFRLPDGRTVTGVTILFASLDQRLLITVIDGRPVR